MAGVDLGRMKGRRQELRNDMSNKFGLGGTHASLIVGQVGSCAGLPFG